MRAARLLQMLLILQNRGRQSCAVLARSLEVSRRTVLRDVDALTEAGLPIVVHRGAQGGVELGFDYRTRLTGLDTEEAEAMAVLLTLMPPELADLGLAGAAARAQAKISEAFPDQTRRLMSAARATFLASAEPHTADPRRAAVALAVREKRIVRLQAKSAAPVTIHPVTLVMSRSGWAVIDARTGTPLPEESWGDVNISARRFVAGGDGGA